MGRIQKGGKTGVGAVGVERTVKYGEVTEVNMDLATWRPLATLTSIFSGIQKLDERTKCKEVNIPN